MKLANCMVNEEKFLKEEKKVYFKYIYLFKSRAFVESGRSIEFLFINLNIHILYDICIMCMIYMYMYI